MGHYVLGEVVRQEEGGLGGSTHILEEVGGHNPDPHWGAHNLDPHWGGHNLDPHWGGQEASGHMQPVDMDWSRGDDLQRGREGGKGRRE